MADTKISDLAAVTDVLTTDEYVLARSNTTKKITAANLAAALSQATALTLSLVVDEDGSSLTNWNQDAGSWSVSGGVFTVDSTAAEARLEYNGDPIEPAQMMIFEFDMKILSTGLSSANDLAGAVWHWDGSTTTATPAVRLIYRTDTTKTIDLEHKATTALSSAAFTWAADTWYTLRVVVTGGSAAAYVDGAFKTATLVATTWQGRRVGLYANGVNVNYRNIKVWVETLPV